MRDRLVELVQGVPYGNGTLGEYFNKSYIDNCIVEHLLANGVIVPPCKVGEKIYIHQFDNKMQKVVVECEITEHNEKEELFRVKLADGRILTLLFQFVGKTVFLTKAEAEQALKGGAE